MCLRVGATPVRRAGGKHWEGHNECVHVDMCVCVSVCETDIVKGISLRHSSIKVCGPCHSFMS